MAKDPVADSTDVYAFVSPNRPDTVTLIANYIPFQAPDGGPNFYEFGDDVAYDIHISNQGTSQADITYRFRFHSEVRNGKTFLYNTGPISSIHDTAWNRPQFYSLTRIKNGNSRSWRVTLRARRSTSARGALRTTRSSPIRRCTRWAAAASSPVSVPTRSMSTWAASSTSGRCDRSSTCT